MSTLLVDTSSEMQVLESNPADAFTSGQPLPEPAAATVDNDEEMLESTGGDVETAQGDDDMDTADTGMRFGTAQISKKRTAGSEGFHQLAVKQLEGRDALCSVDVLQELGAPVRDNDGDAMHCNHTFLFCCSVSSLKKMAACNRCVNPSPLKMACVLEDYSFVISQCDVNKNQNTYFICQVLQTSAKEAYVWYRCGRMGRTSTKSLMGPMTPHIAAIVEFTRMYQNKIGYNWFWSSENERRRPKVGSYGELDIDYSQSKFVTTDNTTRGYLETAFEYIRSIVSPGQDVSTAEGHMTLLGRLSMAQVLKGYNLLEDLEQIVNKTRMKARLRVLSSLYYATIPHDFGKERMSIIESKAKIEAERKFLLTNFVLPVLS